MKKELLFRVGRVAAPFLRAVAFAALAIIFSFGCRLPMRELDLQSAHRIIFILNAIINFFCFQSIIRAIYVHSPYERKKAYDVGGATNNFLDNVRHAMKGFDFWVDMAVFVLITLPVITDLPPYTNIRRAFFYNQPETALFVRVLVPILMYLVFFAAAIVAHDSVRRAWAHTEKLERYKNGAGDGEIGWRKEAQKKSLFKRYPIFHTLIDLLIAAVVYTVAPAGVWVIALVAVPFIALFGTYSWLLGFIIFGIVLAVFLRWMRAINKRRKFVRELTRICKEKGIPLSPVQNPCRSLFFEHVGENFSLEYKGERYDCKLLGALSRKTPYLFSPKGHAICRRNITIGRRSAFVPTAAAKTTLFHIDTEIQLMFSGEGKKVVVLLPIPREIFLINEIGNLYPLDTGDRVGDYRVYNASAFLGALEREFLGRNYEK